MGVFTVSSFTPPERYDEHPACMVGTLPFPTPPPRATEGKVYKERGQLLKTHVHLHSRSHPHPPPILPSKTFSGSSVTEIESNLGGRGR